MTAASFIRISAAAGAMMLLAACGGSDTSSSSSSVAAVESTAPAETSVATADNTQATAASAAPAPAADQTASASPEVVAEAPSGAATDQPAIPTLTAEQASMAAPGGSDTTTSATPTAAAQPPAAGTAAQNWLKICDPTQNGQRACIMRQVVVTPDQHFLGSFLLRDDPSQESRLLAVAAVPLGVLLPFGVTWQIDGGKPIRVPYMLCDPQSCATQLVVNEAYLASLKKGTKLTLTAKNRKNEDLTITINLGGFKTVYDGEAALTPDEFSKNQSGDAALEKILANRAEQARQQLESSASGQ